ncbi:hypothetical protein PP175_28885 (plasmid) [Aneurinibacillus sp. Ricciae_BoGa-3]|uniref:hypothetical protein n=1 Tax=Aneurinibacillus sp. Ricciae_BoGa-3 TaxID=3022697 RepID=UPI0023415A21|nr:hypothetical protein [Aneurinibacillus sp. Ricciae_BoGa-3]WCK57207.1 hypothetical protein PP175_28885 [Aneurinibacillus sp. Ricciae_BoGa-3]
MICKGYVCQVTLDGVFDTRIIFIPKTSDYMERNQVLKRYFERNGYDKVEVHSSY